MSENDSEELDCWIIQGHLTITLKVNPDSPGHTMLGYEFDGLNLFEIRGILDCIQEEVSWGGFEDSEQ